MLASRQANTQVEYLTDLDTRAPPSVPQRAADLSDIEPPEIAAATAVDAHLAGPRPVESVLKAGQLTERNMNSAPLKTQTLSPADLQAIAADQDLVRSRQPAGPPTSIRVFGSSALSGHKFVFLIDRSHSMGEQGLGVLRRAKIEISRAINQLESHHWFQIVVYNSTTATLSKRELLPATDANKVLVPNFIDSLVAFGSTNHQNGLYSALAYRPDVIVMMTDGGFPKMTDQKLSVLRRTVKNATQIHTIEFGRGAPANHEPGFLQRLSKQNNGTYKYIDVRSWNRQNPE